MQLKQRLAVYAQTSKLRAAESKAATTLQKTNGLGFRPKGPSTKIEVIYPKLRILLPNVETFTNSIFG